MICMYIYRCVCIHECVHVPARTAQGGGGSFKSRKPIGEVRCCDSHMEE